MYLQTGVQSNAWSRSRKPSSLSGVRLPRPPQMNKELNTEHYMSRLKSIPSRSEFGKKILFTHVN